MTPRWRSDLAPLQPGDAPALRRYAEALERGHPKRGFLGDVIGKETAVAAGWVKPLDIRLWRPYVGVMTRDKEPGHTFLGLRVSPPRHGPQRDGLSSTRLRRLRMPLRKPHPPMHVLPRTNRQWRDGNIITDGPK